MVTTSSAISAARHTDGRDPVARAAGTGRRTHADRRPRPPR